MGHRDAPRCRSRTLPRLGATVFLCLFCAAGSRAEDLSFEPSSRLTFRAEGRALGNGTREEDRAIDTSDARLSLRADAAERFGAHGTNWWSVGGGVGFTASDTDFSGRLTWHHFLADDFEVNVTAGGWYHDQEDENAASGSLSFGFRWHALTDAHDDRWSVYLDTGVGLLVSADAVPSGGTSYNFIPRAGIGATWRLGDSPARLDVGIRWQHISNASTRGTDQNPARDAAMVTLGVMFPF